MQKRNSLLKYDFKKLEGMSVAKCRLCQFSVLITVLRMTDACDRAIMGRRRKVCGALHSSEVQN